MCVFIHCLALIKLILNIEMKPLSSDSYISFNSEFPMETKGVVEVRIPLLRTIMNEYIFTFPIKVQFTLITICMRNVSIQTDNSFFFIFTQNYLVAKNNTFVQKCN